MELLELLPKTQKDIYGSLLRLHGLFRYDGHEMINYKHAMINYKNDPANPNSLSNNWIESIYIDSAGIIWLGTWGNGLDRFDPATGIFTHYTHDPKNPLSLAQNLITGNI